jgi:hypothetical protein
LDAEHRDSLAGSQAYYLRSLCLGVCHSACLGVAGEGREKGTKLGLGLGKMICDSLVVVRYSH